MKKGAEKTLPLACFACLLVPLQASADVCGRGEKSEGQKSLSLLQQDECAINTTGFWESQGGGNCKACRLSHLMGEDLMGRLRSKCHSCLAPLVQEQEAQGAGAGGSA